MRPLFFTCAVLFLATSAKCQSGFNNATYNKSQHIIKSTNEVPLEQMLSDCVFFGGDSLNGFALATCINGALPSHNIYHELQSYLFTKEAEFVKSKYHISELPFESFAKSRIIHPSSVRTSSCNNVDFENGDFTGWTGRIGYNALSTNPLTITSTGIVTTGMNASWKDCSYHTIISAAGGTDYYGGFPALCPTGGNYSMRLGGENTNVYDGTDCSLPYVCHSPAPGPQTYCGGETIEQTFTVDPTNTLYTFNYAAVMNDGSHPAGHQPYFAVEVLNSGGTLIPCLSQRVELVAGVVPPGGVLSVNGNCWFPPITADFNVYYIPWTANSFNLTAYSGTNVTVRFTAAGCTDGDHFGYAYFDASCGVAKITTVGGVGCAGSTAQLTAPPIFPAVYTWTGPGIVGSSTGQSITANANGIYSVTVGSGGCAYTLYDTLTLGGGGGPVVTVTPTSLNCTITTSTISASAPTGITYLWSGPGIVSGGNTSTATVNAGGTYDVTVTDGSGCSTTASVSVSSNTTPPNVSANSPVNLPCTGNGNVVASSTTSGATFQWSGPGIVSGGNTSTATVNAAGSYSLTVTDPSNGCTSTASVTVNAATNLTLTSSSIPASCGNNNGSASLTVTTGTSPYSYVWNNGATTSTISNLAGGTYDYTVSDANGCSLTGSVIVISSGGLIINLGNDTSVCLPDTILINATTAGASYQWGNGATTATILAYQTAEYYVTVTNGGCTGIDSIHVTENPKPPASVTADQTIFCSGDSAQICANPGMISYIWNTGATTQCITTQLAGNYYLTVTDANGCSAASNHLSISVLTPPPVSVSVNGDTLTAYNSPSYQWFLNGNPIPGATNQTYIATIPGSYTVEVTDTSGCPTFSTAVVITGINDLSTDGEFSVFPNPNSVGNWQLVVGKELIGSRCEIFDAEGRLVFQSEIGNSKSEIQINAARGVYMMRIVSEQNYYTKKLIKL